MKQKLKEFQADLNRMPRARAKQTISSKVSNISSTFEKRIGYMQEANTIPVFNGDILAEFRENWKK